MTEPATDLYMDALRGLTRYGFRRISFIRNLAEDNKNNQAVNFVAAVQTFMHECPKETHLAIMYLIDCVLRTVREPNPYPFVFSVNIAALFAFVWDGANDSTRRELSNLVDKWKHVANLPLKAIKLIDDKISVSRERLPGKTLHPSWCMRAHTVIRPDEAVTRSPVEFSKSMIKEFNQGAVNLLFSASNASRAKFLDLKFARNRRLKTVRVSTRQWYVNQDVWVRCGASGDQAIQAEHGHFDEMGDAEVLTEEEEDEQLPPVEEDPSQPVCAISEERFERYYDPATDKWYYANAIILDGELARIHGVTNRTIVKKHAIAGVRADDCVGSQMVPVGTESDDGDGSGKKRVLGIDPRRRDDVIRTARS